MTRLSVVFLKKKINAEFLIKYEIFMKDSDASLCVKKKAGSFYMAAFSITFVFADIKFEQEVQLILRLF